VSGPFNLAIAPNAEGLFLGDYHALVSIGNVFVPFFVQTNAGNLANRTDVFATLMNSAVASQDAQDVEMKHAANAQVPARGADAQSAMTPELQQRISENIRGAMRRRMPGWDLIMLRQ
jgi:hypothetical protein